MRTTAEIVDRCHQSPQKCIFGFDLEVLVPYLPWEAAKEFVKGTLEESWHQVPQDRAAIIADIREYMKFAWGKVEDHRGISAGRSINKMEAWLWLLGEDDLLKAVEDCEYPQYGAPKLKLICDALDLPSPDEDWALRMIVGESCVPDCDMGCGI